MMEVFNWLYMTDTVQSFVLYGSAISTRGTLASTAQSKARILCVTEAVLPSLHGKGLICSTKLNQI